MDLVKLLRGWRITKFRDQDLSIFRLKAKDQELRRKLIKNLKWLNQMQGHSYC